MKNLRILLTAIALLLCIVIVNAQSPQAIKYQAVARNNNGEVIANQNVSFRISILQNSAEGTTVYQETQTTQTNQFGLANLEIGKGNVTTGQFDKIDWGKGSYFAKVEFDAQGGSNYTVMGTSQLLSVPYSLYAEHAKVADNLPVFPIKASLQATNLQAPFNNPETGMLVYNTDSAGTAPYNVVPGYYYNAGTKELPNWILLSGTNIARSVKQALATGTGVTTYGGLSQDGNGVGSGNVVGNPSGNDNTGFGYEVFGNNASTNPSGADNTGVGYQALNVITSGIENTALGSGALSSIKTGNYCTAIGFDVLPNNTANYNTACGYATLVDNVSGVNNSAFGANALAMNTNSNNTAVGTNAMFTNGSGASNNATGFNALASNSSGSFNVADGSQSLYNNTASNNTAMGYSALYYNTTGTNNTATGYLAMNGTSGSSTSSSNTAMGAYALNINSTGDGNTAVGDSAASLNTSGRDNVAVGYSALYSNQVSPNNVAVGVDALYSETGAFDDGDNTAVGTNALFNDAGGQENSALGLDALMTNTVGDDNTAVGFRADVGFNNLQYATAIGARAKVNISNAMSLGGTNSTTYTFVGIGTSNPLAELDLKDPSTNAATNCHIKSEGTITTVAVTTGTGISAAAITTGSTDVKGNITTTGTNTGGGVNTVLTITFNKTYNVAPIVLITAASSTGQACTYFVNSSTTTFTLNFTGGGSAPSFNYFVIE